MKYFVADSVDCDIYEREIEDVRILGLPLPLQLLVIHAHDSYYVLGDDALSIPDGYHFTYVPEKDGTGTFLVDIGRGLSYGIVFNPDVEKAKVAADKLLQEMMK